ncbi:MAG: hypothetical protein EA417_14585 [Gammaproteobacteria bacterium]|nr:MAG: hypothetical protein EA417_14585 [Gammaproteobacteria bacterium]
MQALSNGIPHRPIGSQRTRPHACLARAGGAVLGVIAIILLVLAVAGFLVWFFACPCERTPGSYLFGEVVEEPVRDWTFANEVRLCQIQVATRPLPHAINLNCMATDDGELYLSCAQCDGKRWSTAALARPEARLRLDDRVYPVTLTRITDSDLKDRAWAARIKKIHALRGGALDDPPDTPRPDDDAWWSFHVESAG